MKDINRLNRGAMWLCILLACILGSSMFINNPAQTAEKSNTPQQTPTPKKGKKGEVQKTPTPKVAPSVKPTATPKPAVVATPTPTPTPATCGKCEDKGSGKQTQAGTVSIKKKDTAKKPPVKKPKVKKARSTVDNGASNSAFLDKKELPSTIKFGVSNISINPGEKKRVSYEIVNSTSTLELFENKSDSIEKIEIDGTDIIVTASGKSGTGKVSAYLKDKDDVQQSFTVKVNQPVVDDLSSDTEKVNAVIGSEKTITFKATTGNGTEVDTNLNAKLDNPKIGKVSWTSANGLAFKPAEEGNGKIRVFAPSNPSQAIEIPVSVSKKAFKELKVAESSVKLRLGIDPKLAVTEIAVSADNNDGSSGEVIIENSNSQIAVTGYEAGKLKIAANTPGVTIITIKAKDDPQYSKTITVTVEKTELGNGEGDNTNASGFVIYNPFTWSGMNWILFGVIVIILAGIYGMYRFVSRQRQ